MIYDISPPIDSRIAVWPGDKAPLRHVQLDMNLSDNLTLSTLCSTVHLGAHADAPSHFCVDGISIGECSLDSYLGRCQVIRVAVERGKTIVPTDLIQPICAERILFNTGTFPNPNCWNCDFAAISPELIDYLAKYHVKLIGIDTPSVDLFDSKELQAHKKLFSKQMAILEGVVLTEVPDGIYELIALPLRLLDFDASPVRAILRVLE